MYAVTSVDICLNSHLGVNGGIGLGHWRMFKSSVVYMAVSLGLRGTKMKMKKYSKHEGGREGGMIKINGALSSFCYGSPGPQQSTHFRNAPDRLDKAIYHRL